MERIQRCRRQHRLVALEGAWAWLVEHGSDAGASKTAHASDHLNR
jgi:hypothetical protein